MQVERLPVIIFAICAGITMSSGPVSADEGGARIRSDGRGGQVNEAAPSATRTRLTPADIRELEDRKPALTSHPARSYPADPEAPPATTDGFVSIVIDMEEDDQPLPKFHEMPEAARMEAVRQRGARVDQRARPLKASLGLLGARDVRSRWLASQVSATVPVEAIERIRSMPDVKALSFDSNAGGPSNYTGVELRAATLTNAFHSAGIRGQSGSRLDGMYMNAAVIEWGTDENGYWSNFVNDHLAFYQANGVSRVWKMYRCDRDLPCQTESWPSPGWYFATNHATWVAGVLLGSIEDGQDPGITDAVERVRRSGQAPRAWLLQYSVNSCEAFAHAVQKAIEDGADIINASMHLKINTPGNIISNTYDCGGVNAILRAALSSGVPVVAAAGNIINNADPSKSNVGTYGSQGCYLDYPAIRPEVVAVASVTSTNATTPYRSTDMAPSACVGTVPVRPVGSNYVWSTPGVAVVAPNDYDLVTVGPNKSSYSTGISGTSFATPAVSGIGLLLQQAYKQAGWTGREGNILLTSLLMLGDGWDPDHMGTQFGQRSGAGRLRGRFPDSASFSGEWGWGYHWVDLADKERVCWPVWDGAALAPNFTTWKWAVTWPESDLQNVADIDLQVDNVCGAYGTERVTGEYDYAIRNRIEVTGTQLTGKCLRMCVYGFSIPAGQTRRVYSIDMIHSDAE